MTILDRDTDLVVEKLRGITGASLVDVLQPGFLYLKHDGKPTPAERVRYNPKARTFFTGNKSRGAQNALMYQFRVALDRRPPLADTCAIVAMFFVPTRQRKDVDNLMKLVMDAATKAGVWRDDSQVIAQASFLELDAERPRTLVAICPFLGTLSAAPLLMKGASR